MTAPLAVVSHDAIVLAGGEGRRLGGVTKANVEVAGRRLLVHALDAAAGARRIVVAGPEALARPGLAWGGGTLRRVPSAKTKVMDST